MRGFAARLACRAIREYQLARAGRPPTCRYAPSCSAYALQAVQQHGVARGAWLAVRRLVRCHPWSSMGWDPVPPRGRAGRRANPAHTGEAVARAARERSEQERKTPPGNATGLRLPACVLRRTADV